MFAGIMIPSILDASLHISIYAGISAGSHKAKINTGVVWLIVVSVFRCLSGVLAFLLVARGVQHSLSPGDHEEEF